MPPLSFMFIAGEASGDTLAAELAKALAASSGGEQFNFLGAGGPRMAAAGVDLAFDLTEHAVVGIVEVLKNYGKFKRFFNQLLDLAAARRPDFIILVDYPGFNLRFAKAIKQKSREIPGWDLKIVYYVSLDYRAQEGFIYRIAREGEQESSLLQKLLHARDSAIVSEFAGKKIVREPVPIEKDEPLKLELQSFLRCVAQRQTPLVSGESAKRALDLAVEITRQIAAANPSLSV